MKSQIIIEVNDKMQKGYSYALSAKTGEAFANDFKPFYTPAKMLEMGVFEGKYCNDCQNEFPPSWFENAKISDTPQININYFNINILYKSIIYVNHRGHDRGKKTPERER